MSELLPTRLAADLQAGLSDYLTTTFALSDTSAQRGINTFLHHTEHGMFKGPYVRTRLPYAPAEATTAALDYLPAWFNPYYHQAEAFARLTSKGERRPEPTIVTTGTGSGKTECFLFPILDHILRAQAAGVGGIKAIILYPMNALANDQAHRLASLITDDPAYTGVRAAIYTGEGGPKRTRVSEDGLITDRYTIRDNPPDLLLTNYKMLDMLLLRHDDAKLWQQSAMSLQYLILDEFHTYDGAQGTDVAMLLRRLGATLKAHWPGQVGAGGAAGAGDATNNTRAYAGLPNIPLTEADYARPLGIITPVGTSATLGSGEESAAHMRTFAETVFGEPFPAGALITETRMTAPAWQALSDADTAGQPRETAEIISHIPTLAQPDAPLSAVVDALYTAPPTDPLAGLRHHPLIASLIAATTQAASLTAITGALFPELPSAITAAEATTFTEMLLAYISHVRAQHGREALGVETHLWVRELSRIDAAVDVSHRYRWSDDGVSEDDATVFLPAIFCRHCGRSGWGALLTPTGMTFTPKDIRAASLYDSPDFRALMHGAAEADDAANQPGVPEDNAPASLRFLHTVNRTLSRHFPESTDADYATGKIIPVLTHTGTDAADLSRTQTCPACLTRDSIRFVGSAIATLTSVAISNMFGHAELDANEKKALVFTDSVQDAAHRAGFIQARSHTFALRGLLRNAFMPGEVKTLEQVADDAVDAANRGTAAQRYAITPPELAEREGFKEFWDPHATGRGAATARRKIKERLQFDTYLEFGLQSRLGRTLELTGTLVAEVDTSTPVVLETFHRLAAERGIMTGTFDDAAILAWMRGILIRMRVQGGIYHPWFDRYIRSHGNRYHIWGGRKRHAGMPAFPHGRSAPAFPVAGPTPADQGMDSVTSARSWYADWTARTLLVPRSDAGELVAGMLAGLARAGVVKEIPTDTSALAYALDPNSILITAPTREDLAAQKHSVQCTICLTKVLATERAISELDGAACLQFGCPGVMHRCETSENYYRTMYQATGKRVVAREHTSLLPDDVRRSYENAFRREDQLPDDPNVLVATPTLEMGIDIGDLSCVMLASMPRTVANYVQRVGRAGRKTGNSLVLSFVRGRGEHLPKLYDPLSVINGTVAPPTTYVNAEEILRRQFVAYVIDALARAYGGGDSSITVPALNASEKAALWRTQQIFDWANERSLLRQVAAVVERSGSALLDAFLTQFGTLITADTAQRLRAWVGSGLTDRLYNAHLMWTRDLDELRHQLRAMTDSLPDLEQELADARKLYDADSTAVRDAERDLKSAQAQLRRLKQTLSEKRNTYWISALEFYGILPNYTLVGDTVHLDLSVTSRDPESQQYIVDAQEFDRSAASAIHELAPGSTFYARGLEITVDAVDLGVNAQDIQHWQLCQRCGWYTPVRARESAQERYEGLAPACARCGLGGIDDVGNVFDVVVLRKVSAEVRRDEAQISDARDDRKRTVFEVIPVADMDDVNLSGSWFVQENGFGVDNYSRVDLTWLNFGRRGTGSLGTITGRNVTAGLFPLCEYCGKIDPRSRHNAPEHHRFWCKYRKASRENTRHLVLARTLTTQGVKITLPPGLNTASEFTLPSLRTAILLGLQRTVGGQAGHLHITELPDPREPSLSCLLVHDSIPGGTGYLAVFKDPTAVQHALTTALAELRDCPCAAENRRACHRCLLGFAGPNEEKAVSRVEAVRILEGLLGVGEEAEAGAGAGAGGVGGWTVSTGRVERSTLESPLEGRFREVLRERLTQLGATITAAPTSFGDKLKIVMPGQRTWTLLPQPTIGGTRPDFLLTSADVNIPQVAIYTDGRHYHASADHNRVADDSLKRQSLRDKGIIPWAVTHLDVALAQTSQTDDTWQEELALRAGALGQLVTRGTIENSLLTAVSHGMVALLVEWMKNPRGERWAQFSAKLPLLFSLSQRARLVSGSPSPQTVPGSPTADVPSPVEGALAARIAAFLDAATPARTFHLADGPLDIFVAVTQAGTARALVNLHDATYSGPNADDPDVVRAWQRWLLWSTVLGLTPSCDAFAATTTSTVDEQLADYLVESAAPTPAASPNLEDWAELFADALPDEEPYLRQWAQAGLPVPELGEEYSGIPTFVSWPDLHICVRQVEDAADAAGAVVDPDTTTIPGWRLYSPAAASAIIAAVKEG
ncbi:MAG: DEAD/DEAH box helicase [Bowdeniella nasicola]|nr:DEAD/DEAH box helicase [Bowdeniella nasicola]